MTATTDATGLRVDPRARRTRLLLHEALLALAHERPLDQISVGDIAERATVSRATFYLHYRDRDDLLADVIDTIIVTEASIAVLTSIPTEVTERTPPPAYLVDFFRDLESNAELFRQVLGPDGSARVTVEMRERLQGVVGDLIRLNNKHRPRIVPDDVHASWIAGALLGLVTHWLQEPKRRPAKTVATQVWRLAIQPAIPR